MTDEPLPQSDIILYQTEDGRTRIQCRFENETVWLTQALLAELFEIGVNTVNYHLKAIFAEGELRPEATIRYYRIVRTEGKRDVAREIEHYNLDAILAVGFRTRKTGGCKQHIARCANRHIRAACHHPDSNRQRVSRRRV